jgi:hypothetical protein
MCQALIPTSTARAAHLPLTSPVHGQIHLRKKTLLTANSVLEDVLCHIDTPVSSGGLSTEATRLCSFELLPMGGSEALAIAVACFLLEKCERIRIKFDWASN